jgi:16S rRNA (cytidine1402-2'-O)-methyltransferase
MSQEPASKEKIKAALYIVATPIGNLEDISFRAVKILQEADCILAEDTRKTGILLSHYNITGKKLISFYSYVEKRKIPDIISYLKQGFSYALVTDAGTPGISDPAFSIIKACIDENIEVFHIPGASAVLTALIVSGLPCERFIFEGFLPTKKGRQTRLNKLKDEERTIVIYESNHRILKTLNELHEHFGDRNIAVCRELTKKFEQVIRGTLPDILKNIDELKTLGEFVIVIAGRSK